jgi:DNA sulfur modification protein DndD
MDLQGKYKNESQWQTRNNPENTLDKIVPERLSGLFFFDGEDIDELAGVDNQDRIQEAIQNVMGLTILERATRHLDAVAGRFEDEVEENASDQLADLIAKKRDIESAIEELNRERDDTKRAKERVETEVSDIEQKLERLDESAALQERRNDYRKEVETRKGRTEEINDQIKKEINGKGFVPLSMPLIRETADDVDDMRSRGLIPSELSNSFIDSLLEAEQCICGRPLEPGTDHYEQVESLRGEALADGVEQSAIRIVGHLNQFSEMEADFFETVEHLVAERKRVENEISDWEEKLDEVSSKLQDLDQTTSEGLSISELEAQRERKETKREELISELARIEERIDQKGNELDSIADDIDEEEDEREEALLAKRRQKAAEEVGQTLQDSFDELKDKIRRWSNRRVKETFDEIATKGLTAEISEEFKLRITQNVGGERVEVDKSTGERQIASLAFIGSLVDIARDRYESDSDSEYFTGGIYPLVMDSPFGALDKSHRREVSRVIPELANQVVVFATDSQWEGPVADEMAPLVGQQYWLDFDPGEQDQAHPQTKVQMERVTARGD